MFISLAREKKERASAFGDEVEGGYNYDDDSDEDVDDVGITDALSQDLFVGNCIIRSHSHLLIFLTSNVR